MSSNLTNLLFVYGILKGRLKQYVPPELGHKVFRVGPAFAANHTLLVAGGLAALSQKEGRTAVGELWEVPVEEGALQYIDPMEIGAGYYRTLITPRCGGEERLAWAYYWDQKQRRLEAEWPANGAGYVEWKR